MSEAREAILARLRQAIGRPSDEQERAAARVEMRLAAPRPNLLPARGQVEGEALVELFVRMAEAVRADVRRVPELAELPATVSAYLREHNLPQKLVMAPHPLLDAAGFESQPLLRVRRGTAAETDEVGLTLAAAGIAETGTLMLASGPEQPTLLSFLPETCIVALPTEDIDGAYEQSWQRLREALGAPPRSVNFVTGPSRTGDIGQKIEFGAHGPRRLCIVLVDRLPAEFQAG